jgi:SAM-dependent methyltransferase
MIKNYWNKFYKKKKLINKLNFPSQFSVFVLGEKENENTLIEFGCGNGRDAFFFSSYFKKVYAFDKSTIAINYNSNKYNKIKNLKFYQQDINNSLPNHNFFNDKKLIYARFFLHTLTNKEISKFCELVSSVLKKKERLFVEYRSNRDRLRMKTYNNHYRNYLTPSKVVKLFENYSFQLIYGISGKGLAKYKNEDAIVTRQIFIKR